MMVTGDCARALGDLASERWYRATGRRPQRTASSDEGDHGDLWPANVEPAAVDVDVAISRTEPAFEGRPGVSEIRALHLDAIAAARRHIFAENQYFTSRTITDAFARRARRRRRPGNRRAVAVYAKRLARDVDDGRAARAHPPHAARGGPSFALSPVLPDARLARRSATAASTCTARCWSSTTQLLMVGSANLSERSLATDTECNLAIEARGDRRLAAVDRRTAQPAARRASRLRAGRGRRNARA